MSKRRRVRSRSAEDAVPTTSSAPAVAVECAHPPCDSRNATRLTDLPNEILVQVLSMLPLRYVSDTVRLVNRQLRHAASCLLSANMSGLEKHIEQALRDADTAVHASTSHYQLEINTRVFGALEILQAQFRLVRAVTWRYPNRLFAGRLVEELRRLVRCSVSSPGMLAFHFQPHAASRADSERTAFEHLSSRFMTHFERHTERLINVGPTVSGAKIVDILDSLVVGAQFSRIETQDGRYRLRASYRLPRCWFTCLRGGDIPSTSSSGFTEWRDLCRFMFMRMRRLVACSNSHELQARHSQRERLLQMPRAPPPLPPPATYSGIGDHPPLYFFYGSMNESAYLSRYDSDFETDFTDPARPSRGSLNLNIYVELDCPLWLAPLAAIRAHDPGAVLASRHLRGFSLAVDFECAGARTDRLPERCRCLVFDDGKGEPGFDIGPIP